MAKKLEAFVPKKRDGLVIQAIGDETIVYDPKTYKAHSLNRPAALVFRHLDGKARISEIAGKLAIELGTSANEHVVRVALDRLGEVGLLTAPVSTGRRRVLRGVAIALVPLVTSVLVPKAVAASSCLPSGTPCVSGPACCGGCCQSPAFTCTGGC